jgi:hypothetical protein
VKTRVRRVATKVGEYGGQANTSRPSRLRQALVPRPVHEPIRERERLRKKKKKENNPTYHVPGLCPEIVAIECLIGGRIRDPTKLWSTCSVDPQKTRDATIRFRDRRHSGHESDENRTRAISGLPLVLRRTRGYCPDRWTSH